MDTRKRSRAALLLLAGTAGASADTYTVGNDACSFTSIQNAVNAAQGHAGPDTIRIANNRTYEAQAIKIGSQELTIAGGFATCAATTASGTTLISGFGGAADSVIEVTGNATIALRGLRISDGDETAAGIGGGIDFEGAGSLNLQNVIVSNNRAGYGGGIAFAAAGTLTLGSDVVVQNNVAANSGGGVRVSGAAMLRMVSPRSTVIGNEALGQDDDTGYGGGIQVLTPADAEIASPGFVNFGAVAFNRAKYGGGIALSVTDSADDGDDTSALLYSIDANSPVRVHDNIASELGGAVFLDLENDTFKPRTVRTFLCAWESRFDHNQAPDGGAFYLDSEFQLGEAASAALFLNSPGCGVGGFPPAAAAVRCAGGVACNMVDANVVAQANGAPASGAIFELREDAVFHADRTKFVDNVADDVIHGLSSETKSGLVLKNCLFARNVVAGRVIAVDLKAYVRNCTIADNTIGLSDVLSLTGDTELFDSIVWQPGKAMLGAGSPNGDFVLTNAPGTLPSTFRTTSLPPRFVDAAGGDYRLRAASPAVDFGLAEPAVPRDIDDLPHDRELPVANAFGPRDLGAYERQSLSPLVLNDSMLADLRFWDVVTAGVGAFDPNENAPGSTGGAMSFDWINDPVVVGRVTSRSQCIHLPLAGTYRLDGFARTTSTGPIGNQRALLHWDLRLDGGEACTSGPVAAGGDVVITGGSAWASAASPANIVVPPAQWTRNSSITIATVMIATGVTPPPGLHGWFDGISLTYLPTGADLFDDGFE